MKVLSVILIILLVILFASFLAVTFTEDGLSIAHRFIGGTAKQGFLRFLALGMGGVLVALQAVISHRRAKAMEATAQAQADASQAQAKATTEQARANNNAEQGQRQERLKNAIEHLGADSVSVRLGGAYELFHLAQDTKDLRESILQILCAHIRQTTVNAEYKRNYESRPSEEIQSLLSLLFVQPHQVFSGLRIDLAGCWLNGAELNNARLNWARLQDVSLQYAQMAMAYLQNAKFIRTDLTRAALSYANLQAAIILDSCFQEANLDSTNLQGAVLEGVRLQRAYLGNAKLHGVGVLRMEIGFDFASRIRGSIGEETDLSGVKDILLSPSVNSDAITGSYSEEDANKWIIQFNQDMNIQVD